MQAIQMVDLRTQTAKIREELNAAIAEVIDAAAFIKGSAVAAFEDELGSTLNGAHVIGCGNGTDALQIALMALELQPGDEVITADFTYIATAEVIALLGLKPVLVDVDPRSFCIDPEQVKAAISEKTRAVIPVHLFGQCADMEALLAVTQPAGVPVVEDTAQAIGARYTFSSGERRFAGCMGDIGTTSFFPSKNLGCFGDGGAMMTRDTALAERLRMIANHGQPKRYTHDLVGVNSRLDTLQAAILRVKLKHLSDYTKARQALAARYDEQLGEVDGVRVPWRDERSEHVFHQYTLVLSEGLDRDVIAARLREEGIPTGVYYPKRIRDQRAYRDLVNSPPTPVSERLCKSVLSLPMHTEMSAAQSEHITAALKRAVQEG